MKTRYKKPELTVVGINKPCLLAGSIQVAEKNFKEGDVVLSKGGWSLWSDEDEPEEVDY